MSVIHSFIFGIFTFIHTIWTHFLHLSHVFSDIFSVQIENYIKESMKAEMAQLQQSAVHNHTAAMLEMGTSLLSQTAEQTRKLTDVETQVTAHTHTHTPLTINIKLRRYVPHCCLFHAHTHTHQHRGSISRSINPDIANVLKKVTETLPKTIVMLYNGCSSSHLLGSGF